MKRTGLGRPVKTSSSSGEGQAGLAPQRTEVFLVPADARSTRLRDGAAGCSPTPTPVNHSVITADHGVEPVHRQERADRQFPHWDDQRGLQQGKFMLQPIRAGCDLLRRGYAGPTLPAVCRESSGKPRQSRSGRAPRPRSNPAPPETIRTASCQPSPRRGDRTGVPCRPAPTPRGSRARRPGGRRPPDGACVDTARTRAGRQDGLGPQTTMPCGPTWRIPGSTKGGKLSDGRRSARHRPDDRRRLGGRTARGRRAGAGRRPAGAGPRMARR